MVKEIPIRLSPHVLSRCVVIPNKFPTLLAEREIIANAFFFTIRSEPTPSAEVFGGHKARFRVVSGTKIVKVLLAGAKIRGKFMGCTKIYIITKVKQQFARQANIQGRTRTKDWGGHLERHKKSDVWKEMKR